MINKKEILAAIAAARALVGLTELMKESTKERTEAALLEAQSYIYISLHMEEKEGEQPVKGYDMNGTKSKRNLRGKISELFVKNGLPTNQVVIGEINKRLEAAERLAEAVRKIQKHYEIVAGDATKYSVGYTLSSNALYEWNAVNGGER